MNYLHTPEECNAYLTYLPIKFSHVRYFKNRRTRVLVATDIAARGIDIDELSHVVNFDLPNIPETYVHRIGRTGRAGASGIAISFCSGEEKPYLRDIEKLIRKSIPVKVDGNESVVQALRDLKGSMMPGSGSTNQDVVAVLYDILNAQKSNTDILNKILRTSQA